ncbi:hypothetical protein POM88_007161 [Heracleum sosnowskyi]|uniref:Uncharacterized protein n=1 Tax=Heracleum sosnowskyi TaxID=360622 RepID=A0AAD8J4W9_9APIA|nr:hypothetical protein POM88_007161 [Heracleum sosnowskyi]
MGSKVPTSVTTAKAQEDIPDYEEYGEGAISALGEDKVIGDDDEYDELYKDINIGEGCLQFQQSHEAPGPSANGAVNEVNIGEDDECDELYSDINIGKGCLHPQLSEAPGPSANGAMNEVISEDEEYNELYGDIKIEEGFLQLHLSEAPGPSAKDAVNEGFQVQNTTVPEPRTIYLVPKESHIHGVPTDEKDTDSGVQFLKPRNQVESGKLSANIAFPGPGKSIEQKIEGGDPRTKNLLGYHQWNECRSE